MNKVLDSLYFGAYKWYRRYRKGNWKWVGPKYCPEGCWIHNSQPYPNEVVWEEENYG